jgi:hypothetical protein
MGIREAPALAKVTPPDLEPNEKVGVVGAPHLVTFRIANTLLDLLKTRGPRSRRFHPSMVSDHLRAEKPDKNSNPGNVIHHRDTEGRERF